jgi:CHAT domain-containing protein
LSQTDSGVWQVLVTKSSLTPALCVEEGLTPMRANAHGRTVGLPATGRYVGWLRGAVQLDPGPLDVSAEGARVLQHARQHFAQVVVDQRANLVAAGIDRLLVVPHAASRFVPIHLLGPPDMPLADDWTITYLLNIAQLTVEREPAPARDRIGVFGLSYRNLPRLSYLPDSEREAAAIAEVCGSTANLDDSATKAAFIDALQTCRYVHLRAHGRMYVDAPSFHTVFLHPTPDQDGKLRAYEVLPLDLTGLELVTLGACETALARVDLSDNPRGLPAALLLAGAQSVIGTLWPVLAAASTHFFHALYTSLIDNGGNVTSAFAHAQRETRSSYPQYRDWGAFYLIGGLDRTR